MGVGDALYDYPLTLPKGKYSMQVLVRHDSKAMLDRLTHLVVPVDFTLAKDLAVPLHTSMHDALAGADKTFSGGAMARGSRVRVFVSAPAGKAPGGAHGDVLVGAVRVGGGTEWKVPAREDCVLQVLVPKEAAKDKDKDAEKKDKSDAEAEQEEVRDARLKRLKKLREDKKWGAADALAQALLAEFPQHLPLLSEVLSRRDRDGEAGETAAERQQRCAAAIECAAAVVAAVDVASLAAHFGLKHDTEDPAAKEACKSAEQRKEALLPALLSRVERWLELMAPAPSCESAAGV
eukprot:3112420-Rhodomonas_salina.1